MNASLKSLKIQSEKNKTIPNELHYYDYTIKKDKFTRDDIALLLSEQSYKKITDDFLKKMINLKI